MQFIVLAFLTFIVSRCIKKNFYKSINRYDRFYMYCTYV